MDCTVSPFGKIGNEIVWLYTFVTANGIEISITNYGAAITAINLIHEHSKMNLVYGYENMNPYIHTDLHVGGLIGRYANRIQNAQFNIDGKNYKLTQNDGGNTLHGGCCGFDKQIWETQYYEVVGGVGTLRLYLRSATMEEGFPGNLDVWVTFQITDDNQVCLNYSVKTDSPTHVNLTSHSYFNLCGFANSIDELLLQINADRYLALNDEKIPTGEMVEVKDTPYDFTKFSPIGANIGKLNQDEFDCCYVLNNPRLNSPSVVLRNATIGLTLSVYTNQPGLQLYTPINKPADSQIELPEFGRWAICLEPQHFPNTPNIPSFPSTLLCPDDEYCQTVVYIFDVND